MGHTDDGMQFCKFVNRLREKKNLSVEKLCAGLCSPRTVWYLESGERLPDKLIQDAILERLGIGAEDYEHFLDPEEYGRWEARQHILHSITFGETKQAECLLEEYSAAHDMGNKLEKQFYLSMLAQVRRCQGCGEEELRTLTEEAVRLTVSLQEPLAGLVLSVKELNLVLEAERCCGEEERPERYQEIAEYIEANGYDRLSRAKIYPKAVFFLCRCAISREEKKGKAPAQQFLVPLLKYCNDALEVLRDNGRMYYLWEILDMREQLLGRMMEELAAHGSQKKADSLRPMYQENRAWRQVLEAVYAEFRVPKETFEYCYLYVVKGVSCINDVIRIRRGMLGMSQKELCDGICDVKTLRRIEGRKTSPQRGIVRELFERLGLSGELVRTEFVTDSIVARELMWKLRDYCDRQRRDLADELLTQIRKLVPVKMRCNQQVLMFEEAVRQRTRGELSNTEAYYQLKNALELTIAYEAFLKEGEKYLTNEEQTCIINMMLSMDKDGKEFWICINRFEELYQPYFKNKLEETATNMYEFVLSNVGSAQGNKGEFDKSDYYNGLIIQGCLRFHRLIVLPRALYECWWNRRERRIQGISITEIVTDAEELNRCILLANLGKQDYYEQFYREEIESIGG